MKSFGPRAGIFIFPLFFSTLLSCFGSSAGPNAQSTAYSIHLASSEQHLLEVKIVLAEGPGERILQLPVWNAVYQVRDFSQYVNWVRARDRAGKDLSVVQLDKSSWRVTGAQAGAVVDYLIYVDSSGPFGAQFNSQHAFLNLAQVLMFPVDARDRAVRLRFTGMPAGWQVATPLEGEAGVEFTAPNYDRLVDSPVEIGTFQEADFDQESIHYRVIVDAEATDYSMEKIIALLRQIVGSATNWMNDRPLDHYMFIYHFPRGPAGGGMEHAYSASIDVNQKVLAQAPEPLASITAHEFFHLWNVKRIRPEGLDRVDYAKENYTRALWFSEGCTSTAADFIQLRAGLMNEQRFESQVAAEITELERRPAHGTQSAEESSLDAWLEGDAYYRRPERSISYYNKGELIGVALDLTLRERSDGRISLRELFQWMNENYAKKHIAFPDGNGVQMAAEAVSHSDFKLFFEKYVRGVEEIPWDVFFRVVGLRLEESRNTSVDAGFAASRNFDGPMTVTQVSAGGEAERAGLHLGDTIVEINGTSVGQESSDSLAGTDVGEMLKVKVRAGRGGERELSWRAGSREEVVYELKDVEHINAAQRTRRAAWLKGEAEISPSAQAK